MPLFRFCVLPLGLSFFLFSISLADERGHKRFDHDEAQRAVESGAIRPFEEILAKMAPQPDGEIVRVKLEHEKSRWMYEIRILNSRGELKELHIDAASGAADKMRDD